MTAYLLDVNVLIALLDKHHVHHAAARHWFKVFRSGSWATCPITENSFVRIVTNKAYRVESISIGTAVNTLRAFCEQPEFVFWPDEISIRDLLAPDPLLTNAQLTDAYLLGLAVHRGGKLATFDQRIPSHAVEGGDDALELIDPREGD